MNCLFLTVGAERTSLEEALQMTAAHHSARSVGSKDKNSLLKNLGEAQVPLLQPHILFTVPLVPGALVFSLPSPLNTVS